MQIYFNGTNIRTFELAKFTRRPKRKILRNTRNTLISAESRFGLCSLSLQWVSDAANGDGYNVIINGAFLRRTI